MFKLKKVLFLVRNLFTYPAQESYTHCIRCGLELIGSQKKFCSTSCNNRYHNKSKNSRKNIRKPVSDEIKELDNKKQRARIIAYKIYPSLKGIKCEICGKKAEHRHHGDYDKPEDVVFVCRFCHEEIHSDDSSNIIERGFKK